MDTSKLLPRPALYALPLLAVLLTGCNDIAIPGLGPDPRTVAKESEAKAIGGACRHAMRGLEDCYTLNPKASKALVFNGWKDMDQYMRDNKIEGTPSVLTRTDAAPAKARQSDADIETEYRNGSSSNGRRG